MVLGATQSYPGNITATMDGGTAATGNTWYQIGADSAAPTTGIPMSTTFSTTDSLTGGDTFQMQGVTANNALFVGRSGPFSATYTLTSPAGYSTLSLLGAAGNGPVPVNVTVNYVGGSTYNTSVSVLDWFTGGSNVAYVANGRVAPSPTWNNVSSGDPLLYYFDLAGIPTAEPISSISFSTTDTGGNAGILAISERHGFNFHLDRQHEQRLEPCRQRYELEHAVRGIQQFHERHLRQHRLQLDDKHRSKRSALKYRVQQQHGTLFVLGLRDFRDGSVLMSGAAGSVTFNNANTYTGTTTIIGGTLTLANPLAVQTAPSCRAPVTGLAFALGNTTPTFGGISGGGTLSLQDSGQILSPCPLATITRPCPLAPSSPAPAAS